MYNHHNTNINIISISAIKSTYRSMYLHMKSRNEFLINECNKPTEDGPTMFHLTIEWMSQISLHSFTLVPYSKHDCGAQTKITQLGHIEAKLPHPHQHKLGFTIIHPGSLGQHNEHIIIGFTVIST